MNSLNSLLRSLNWSKRVLIGFGKYCSQGITSTMLPAPTVLGELIVSAHHLQEIPYHHKNTGSEATALIVFATDTTKNRWGSKYCCSLVWVRNKTDELSDLAHDVLLKSLLGVDVGCGEVSHGAVRDLPMQFPPLAVITERHAFPIGTRTGTKRNRVCRRNRQLF